MPDKQTCQPQCIPLSRLSLDVLLALRIVLDENPSDDHSLKKHLQALRSPPENDLSIIRQAWSRHVSRSIPRFAKSHGHLGSPNLIGKLMDEVTEVQAKHPLYQQYLPLLNMLKTKEKCQETEDTTHWRQQLLALLLPLTTLSNDVTNN